MECSQKEQQALKTMRWGKLLIETEEHKKFSQEWGITSKKYAEELRKN